LPGGAPTMRASELLNSPNMKALMDGLEDGFNTLEQAIPFDLIAEIKKSKFFDQAQISREEFDK